MQTKEQEVYEPTDRRPIATRGWSIWQPLVRRMVHAGVSANTISIAGMVAGFLAGVAFVMTACQPEFARWSWLSAAIFMQLRLLANLLDGMVAIESGKASVVGELRYRSWLILVPIILLPILTGAIVTMIGIGLLSLLCFREYSRVTQLNRERTIYVIGCLGIVLLTLSSLDNWYRLFVALTPLTICTIAAIAIVRDQPRGYIQRVGLAVLGFALFGSCLGHLGFLANDSNYRAMLILIFLCVELNDVFGFVVGKTLGNRKLAPNTSPGKTIAGALGALILTTLLFCVIGRFVFIGTNLAAPIHLLVLGAMVSLLGQFGDLMLSSIKRDLDIKDMASTIPGHGGFLDRFDSMILVAPAFFHYVNYFVGVGSGIPVRIYTGS